MLYRYSRGLGYWDVVKPDNLLESSVKRANYGSKLTIFKENKLWLAKSKDEWWEECRISNKQFDRSIKILEDKGLVEKKLFKFNGTPTIHIHLNVKKLVEGVEWILTKGQNGIGGKDRMESEEKAESITETTASTTTKNTNNIDAVPYAEIENLYNSICDGFPKVRKLTKLRKRRINDAWNGDANKDIKFFEELFKRANGSDFLRNGAGTWSGADIEWMLNEENINKILEGKYDNKKKGTANKSKERPEGKVEIIRSDKTYEESLMEYVAMMDEENRKRSEEISKKIKVTYDYPPEQEEEKDETIDVEIPF